jgi:inhibitor of KinA sporulation pathway (predicted exonuclease)
MIRWALDLELEQNFNNPQTPDSHLDEAKIIQIGATFVNIFTKEVVEDKKWYINIGVPVSQFIKSLTNISQSEIDSGTDIKTAYEELLYLIKKYKCFYQPITWGSGDLRALMEEVQKTDAKWVLGQSEMNTKALFQAYSQYKGIKSSGGLAKSMAKCGLKFQGRAHDALIDSKNTMDFFLHLMEPFK